MKCSACGKKLATGISRCPRCGQQVQEASGPAAEPLPTATMQVSDFPAPPPGSGTAAGVAPASVGTGSNPDVRVTGQAPPRPGPTNTTQLPESWVPRSPADVETTYAAPPRAEGPGATTPPSADDTSRGHGTLIHNDSQALRQAWGNLASDSATPYVTLKGSHGRAEFLDSMLIQRRSLKPIEQSGSELADYQLLKFVGEGGMGTVYAANQSAVQRTVAIKTLKPEFARRQADRAKFLNEAKITGDLAHPNIVPIHDLGISDDGTVFYSMKLVGGESWDDVMRRKSRQENLEILHRVCDAMAFAHSRQVIHRDLKPENIMLGEFGEVLVMDWGLAVNLGRANDFVLGGTPAYMAPEMAVHDVERIGFASDIYLLSAILYEVVTGFPPHPGSTVTECVAAAARNTIIPFETDDELLQIALQGMSSDPGARYPNVAAFKRAVAEYQSHLESISAAERGYEELEAAETANGYERFSRSVFSFQESLELWPENRRAQQGLREARLAYAQRALKQEDFDLGMSLISESREEEAVLYRELKHRAVERASRQRRLRIARWAAAGFAGLAVLAMGAAAVIQKDTIAEYLEYSKTQNLLAQAQNELDQRQHVLDQKNNEIAAAETARAEAERLQLAAQEKERESSQQLARIEQQKLELQKASELQQARVEELDRSIADKEQLLTKKQREVDVLSEKNVELVDEVLKKNEALEKQIGIATARKNAAQLGQYQSDILLSKAMIEEGQVSRALNRLQATFANDQIPPQIKGWELHRLYQMCHQSGDFWVPDGETVLQLLHDAANELTWAITSAGRVYRSRDLTGTKLGFEQVASIEIAGPVQHAALSPNGRWLAVGLRQANVPNLQIWDLQNGSLAGSVPAHLADVRFVHFPDNEHLYTIGNHTKFFQAAQWTWDGTRCTQQSAFFGFEPVEVAAISRSGKRLAVGCDVQQVYLFDVEPWKADGNRNFGQPFQGLGGFDFSSLCFDPSDPEENSLICGLSSGEVVRVRTANAGKFESLYSHREAVTTLQPVAEPVPAIFSCSEDETIKRFDLPTARVHNTITGQLGTIRANLILPNRGIMIAADDSPLVRTWPLAGIQDEQPVPLPEGASALAALLVKPDPASPDYVLAGCDERNVLRLISSPQFAESDAWQVPGHRTTSRFQAQIDRDGRRIATAAADGQLLCYDTASGCLIGRHATHDSATFALAPNGEILVAVDPADDTKLAWGPPDAESWTNSLAVGLPIDGLLVDSQSQRVAVRCQAGAKSKILFVDLSAGATVGESLERIDFHSWAADGSDGILVASSFETGAVSERRLFRYRQGKRDARMNQAFEHDLDHVHEVDGQEKILTHRFIGDQNLTRLAIWGSEIWEPGAAPQSETTVPGRIAGLSFDPLEQRVLVTLPDGGVQSWRPDQGDSLQPLPITAAVENDWFSQRKPFDARDERWIENPIARTSSLLVRVQAVGSQFLVVGQGNLSLVDQALNTRFRIFPTPAPRKFESLNATSSVVSMTDGRVWVISVAAAAGTPQFGGERAWQVPGWYRDASVGADDQVWLVAEDGRLVRLNVSDRTVAAMELPAWPNSERGIPVTLAAAPVAPPGAEAPPFRIALGLSDGRLILLEGPDLQTIREFRSPRELIPRYHQLVFSKDSRFLCGVGVDGSAVLWNTNRGEPVELADASHDVPVTQIAFNQASSRLALGRADGSVSILLTSEDIALSATADRRLGGGVPELFSFPATPAATPRPVTVLQFTPEDRELWTAVQGDGKFVRWFTAGWELEKPYRSDEQELDSASSETASFHE